MMSESTEKQAQRDADERADWGGLCRRLGADPARVPLDDWEALHREVLRWPEHQGAERQPE